MEFDAKDFRRALGHFPTGVVVVTAQSEYRDPVAITVNSFNSVSLDPPLVLFSISRSAPSLDALISAPCFGISVLRQDQRELSHRFATQGERKWAGLSPISGDTGCPLVAPCLATFECERFAVYEGGDHLIILGRVLRFEVTEEGDPLVFFRGEYRAIAGHPAPTSEKGNHLGS